MKTFIKSLAGLILIAVIACAVIGFIVWARLPDIVASNLSKTLQTGVEIGDIKFGLKKLGVEQFEIDNPKGFKLSKALGVATITIEAPLIGYLHKDVTIEEITLDNVYIGLEFDSPKSTKGNWTTIMGNAQSSQSSHSKVDKTVFIKQIVLNNIQTDLLYHTEKKVRHLPVIQQIVLKNISSKGGNLSDQLLNSALGQMIKEIFIQENLKDALDQIFKLPDSSNPVQDALQQFKGFFNATDNHDSVQFSGPLASREATGPQNCTKS